MMTIATHKLNVNMPAGLVSERRAAACVNSASGADFTDGSLAERSLR